MAKAKMNGAAKSGANDTEESTDAVQSTSVTLAMRSATAAFSMAIANGTTEAIDRYVLAQARLSHEYHNSVRVS